MSHSDRVRAFFAAWGSHEDNALRSAYERWLHPDCRYENCGLPTLQGLAAITEFFFSGGGLVSSTGSDHLGEIVRIEVDLRHILGQGQVVFSERVDHHYNRTGVDVLTPRIAGVMEFQDDLIIAWRDYFDPASFSQRPG